MKAENLIYTSIKDLKSILEFKMPLLALKKNVKHHIASLYRSIYKTCVLLQDGKISVKISFSLLSTPKNWKWGIQRMMSNEDDQTTDF